MQAEHVYRLEDPFIGFNELKAEWVGKAAWSYKLDFASPEISSGCLVELVFEGLDTFANVKLDGLTILESDNMFLPHRVDITKAISRSEKHTLEIDFESALLKGSEIKSQHPEHKWVGFNGDMGRLAVRKAQYHWGWDWGPVLNCAGIWRPVRLEVFKHRIVDVRVDIELEADLKTATVDVIADLYSSGAADVHAEIILRQGTKIHQTVQVQSNVDSKVSGAFTVNNPQLWMPNGYGQQSLYDIDIVLKTGSEVVDKTSKRVGIRKVELVQQPDKHGKSFFFRINGVDIFCGGSCWIPADSFLTNISPERYRSWLELMVPANQKMIRSVLFFSFCRPD